MPVRIVRRRGFRKRDGDAIYLSSRRPAPQFVLGLVAPPKASVHPPLVFLHPFVGPVCLVRPTCAVGI